MLCSFYKLYSYISQKVLFAIDTHFTTTGIFHGRIGLERIRAGTMTMIKHNWEEIKMRPVIGITLNYTTTDTLGVNEGMGAKTQDWQLIASDYIRAVERAGGAPVILPITDSVDTIWELVKGLDGIVFTGGADIDPALYGEEPIFGLGTIDTLRDGFEFELLNRVIRETSIPVLGICRGFQLINIAFGGTLYQDMKTQRPEGMNHSLGIFPKYYPAHILKVKEGSWMHGIFDGEIGTNSLHHQAVKDLGKGLIPTLHAKDGLVEGFELEGERFLAAVQWHPEMMIQTDAKYLRFFEGFIETCKKS